MHVPMNSRRLTRFSSFSPEEKDVVKEGCSELLLIAAGLTIFCVFVFLKGLGIPLPIIGSWLGG